MWVKDKEPENWEEDYWMSIFSMQLNRLTTAMNKSDSRLRPDQRALEEGDIELATTEKDRLEEKQRDAKKKRDEQGVEHVPRYFKKELVDWVDRDGAYDSYIPIRDYWTDKQDYNIDIF